MVIVVAGSLKFGRILVLRVWHFKFRFLVVVMIIVPNAPLFRIG